MKFFLLCLMASYLFILNQSAFAEPTHDNEDNHPNRDSLYIEVGAIVGYQTLQRTFPYDHNEGVLTYGGRAVVGTYELAGEFEFIYGGDTETFSTPNISVDTTFVETRLGVRKVYPITESAHLVARLGMEAYKYSNNYTSPDGPSSDSQAWQFRPYLGGGVILYAFKSLSLSIEEVYVLDTSWETTFGFRLFL